MIKFTALENEIEKLSKGVHANLPCKQKIYFRNTRVKYFSYQETKTCPSEENLQSQTWPLWPANVENGSKWHFCE